MKSALKKCSARVFAPALMMTSTLSVSAQSADQILLEIDITDLSAVKITSTGNFSIINDDSSTVTDGVWLQGVFSTGGTATYTASSSTLMPAGSTDIYAEVYNDYKPLITVDDWGIYGSSAQPQDFQTNTAAFIGSLTADFSSSSSVFSTAGTTGEIYVGDGNNGSNAVIGYYQIVPEPTSITILAGAGLLILRRRRG